MVFHDECDKHRESRPQEESISNGKDITRTKKPIFVMSLSILIICLLRLWFAELAPVMQRGVEVLM